MKATKTVENIPRAGIGNSAAFIAIVDDDFAVANALRRFFHSAGFKVATFTSGEEFIATLPSHQPDCLLLDLHMLGLSGMDVHASLWATGASFPVILMTGRDEPGMAERALLGGITAFMIKPLDTDHLLLTVQQLLESD